MFRTITQSLCALMLLFGTLTHSAAAENDTNKKYVHLDTLLIEVTKQANDSMPAIRFSLMSDGATANVLIGRNSTREEAMKQLNILYDLVKSRYSNALNIVNTEELKKVEAGPEVLGQFRTKDGYQFSLGKSPSDEVITDSPN